MKLSKIIVEADSENRTCEYCPSKALDKVWGHYVCGLHIDSARRDYEEAEEEKGTLSLLLASEKDEQPDIKDDDDDEQLDAGISDVSAEALVEGVIRKEGDEWCVRSPNNPDWSGGCYKSKEKAKKRLRQIEFFKHQGAFIYEGELFQANSQGLWWFNTRKGSFMPYRLWREASVTGVQKVPQEDHPEACSGILFVCQGRVLLVKRSHDEVSPNLWSIPGGHIKVAPDGMPQDAWGSAKREVKEEMGGLPPGVGKATRKHRITSKTGKTYLTYVVELPPGSMKWRPQLNPEHSAYRWCNRKETKGLELHPNVKRVLRNSDVWDGKFFATRTIHLERDAQTLGELMQQGKLQNETLNAAAQNVYDNMAKDSQYVRLELMTVVHGPPGYTPVSGVAGVFRKGSTELFFQVSISATDEGNLRVLLTSKKTGLKKAATFKTSKSITMWITKKLFGHLSEVAP